ncbi:MAG: FtsX-like permease family protein [Lachnospiraceae bacterium]|nr:FtsX-like permease family protein [Lachnospiraceae bacterium]
MFLHILGRDLKRKRTMNLIVLVFIILSSMFLASSLNNVVTILNGTDYFLDKAGVGDYIVATMGYQTRGCLDEFLDDNPAIKSYTLEDYYGISGENIRVNGKKVKTASNGFVEVPKADNFQFFDTENRLITEVPEGKAYYSVKSLKEFGISKGDTVTITIGETKIEVEIIGAMKDGLLGSGNMTQYRFLVNQKEFDEFEKDESVRDYYFGQVCNIFTDDVKTIKSEVSEISGIGFDAERSIIAVTYVMNMILAMIVLIVSVAFILVSFLVLKFTIRFTIQEEYREIGVMKAIGMSNFRIRSFYIVKYLGMAVIGAILGFFLSIPFGSLLLRTVSATMVLGNDLGILMNLIGSVLVVFLIVGHAYLCTSRIRKSTPVDAIRQGQSGERFGKKGGIRLGNNPFGTILYLSINDITSSPKRFFTIIATFAICSLMTAIIANTTKTMVSRQMTELMSVKLTDLYIIDVGAIMKNGIYDTGEGDIPYMEHLREELKEEGIEADLCYEKIYKYQIRYNGNEESVAVLQGIGTEMTDYVYLSGTAPQSENEVAISLHYEKKLDLHIGDEFVMIFPDREERVMITAVFQSFMQGGECIRIHQDVKTDASHFSSANAYQVDLKEPTPENLEKSRDVIVRETGIDEANILNSRDFAIRLMGVLDVMKSVELMLVVITLIVVMLITILMERSFISDEKAQIAMMKAIGFKNGSIIGWHVMRFGIVAFLSVLIAMILAIPLSQLIIAPVFGIMGTEKVVIETDILKSFAVYPLLVFAVTALFTWIAATHTRTIHANDTANIE